jgi:predicted permease
MSSLFRKLGWWLQRRRREDGLREELQFHLEQDADERRADGVPEGEARWAARRDLGNVTLLREEARTLWTWTLFEQLAQDVRYAVRALRRTPGVTLPAVITLALGIGLTTAGFSVVYGILLRPLPFSEPDRLVALHTIRQSGDTFDNALSAPNFMSLKEEESGVFTGLAGSVGTARTLTGVAEALRLDGTRVSAGFFEVLGVRPILGRTFRREENEPGHERVVVLGHALWQQWFGGDADVIGRTIQLDATAHTVVGVMPQGFSFPGGRAFWLPQPYGSNFFSAVSTAGRRGTAVVRVVGRLRPGLPLASAQTELDARSRQLEEQFPEANAGVGFTAVPLRDDLVGDARTPLLLLFGAVAVVLFIAGANVAGLLLARGASRQEEIAVRGALGAGRARIVRQLATESLVLSLGGGVLGLLLAFWATDRFVAWRLDDLQRDGLVDAVRVDATVLVFAVGVTICAGVLAGLLPAFRTADGLAGALQPAGRSGSGLHRGRRVRSALVVGQVALAVVLLHGAGLLLRSFVRLTSVDPGFRSEQVLSFRVALPPAAYDSNERIESFFTGLFEGIGRHTDVLSAGGIHHLPIGSAGSFRSRFQLEGRTLEEEPVIGVRIVTPEYFRTVGMPVLRGRGITDQDRAGGLPIVVINERAAAQFFAGENPIGRRLAAFRYDAIENAADAFTVVGVVGDVRSRGLGEAPQAEAYFAHAQAPHRQMFVVVRTAGDPRALIGSIRAELMAIDENVPVADLRTLNQVVADSVSRPRILATLLSVFSGVALTLAAVGMFGLLSFLVARRTPEMGIRIALGASPGTLVRAIVREALGLVLIGLGIGFGGALALTRTLESELFLVAPTDLVTFTGVAAMLGATALVASLLPAWRAAAVDPLVALRAE